MNRESAIIIKAIRASGEVIPPFIILSGSVHIEKWYRVEDLPLRASIAVSPTRYINDELIIEWLRHFNRVIKA